MHVFEATGVKKKTKQIWENEWLGHYLQDNLLVVDEFLEVAVAEYQLKWAVQSINTYW